MPKDKYIGKIVRVYLPNMKRPKYRWIIKKRDDGRYIVRAPKRNVYFRDLNKKLDHHFNKEELLPKNSLFVQTKTSKNKQKKNKTAKAGDDFPAWYAERFTPTPSKSKTKSKSKSKDTRSNISPNIMNRITTSLYPAWYKKIPYPTKLDKLYLFETSILNNNYIQWDTSAQYLWKKHLIEMKKNLDITTIKNNHYLILKKGTILYHTANRILPFHDLHQKESSYPFPSYFFGLSSIISLWYAVEKYTEYKRHQEKTRFKKVMEHLAPVREINSRESPPYYLNIYELTEDLKVLYLTDDIGLNQESSIGVQCRSYVPCLHPQYAYHSIEQLYTKRGPAELDWELTIPNRILEDGFLHRKKYAPKNPFGPKLGPIKFMLPPIKPLAAYKIDHKLLLKHAYDNINDFDPLKSIDLHNPVWKL